MVFIHVFPFQMECDSEMIMEIWMDILHGYVWRRLLSISHIGR